MCGITGLWDSRARCSRAEAASTLRAMAQALVHRGPDDEGYFQDDAAGVGFGFRRLSIIDLSHEGHQPMVSPGGRYVIVFNGEVYNHRELRPELERAGVAFRGHSDTEVMLAAIEQWGLAEAVRRFNGMFAFALWDRQEQLLTLVRDRVGIKPLYYGWVRGMFVFGSELKSIRVVPGFDNSVNRDALAAYLRFNYVPRPWSIYRDLYELRPGSVLRINAQMAGAPQPREALDAALQTYWSARDVAAHAAAEPFHGSDDAAMAALEDCLRKAVGSRMLADVPLGALLSGGVDSSTVVALMQQQSTRPVQTFSIGFAERDYDEARHAKAVATHLGTEHTELYVTPQQARDVIPRLPRMYDEPFADSSQIPTFLVSQLARQHVTVALSGDGGDELFGGYNRYFWVQRLWRQFARMPLPARHALARVIKLGSPAFWDGALGCARPVMPARLRVVQAGHKMHRLADVLQDRSPQDTYRRLVSQWDDPATVVIGAHEPPTVLDEAPPLAGFAERMMWMDFASYLSEDILTKVDRASMATSLEARVPLLDHRVVEFAWRLPLAMKIRDGQGKWLLRQVLYRHVPKQLIERPKQGFGIPLEHWLRGPLREWAESLLDEKRLREEGFFNPAPIRKAWAEHLSGRHNRQHHLWSVLMFEAWLQEAGVT